MSLIFVIILALGGIGLMFGWVEPKGIGRFLAWLIIGPVLLCLAYTELLVGYNALPFGVQLLCWILLPFVALVVLRVFLPRAAWVNALLRVLFDLLVFLVTFPLRFAWRSVSLLANRERRAIHLARHQAVVGQRPPEQMQQPDSRRQ
jgi:hypothetical protein